MKLETGAIEGAVNASIEQEAARLRMLAIGVRVLGNQEQGVKIPQTSPRLQQLLQQDAQKNKLRY